MKTCIINNQKFEWENNNDFLEIIKNFPNFKIGKNFKIGDGFTALIPCKVEKVFSTNTLYKYHSGVLLTDKGNYIILGCFCRLETDWEQDFWNNTNEFPNNGSENSNNRYMAYQMCKTYIKLNT